MADPQAIAAAIVAAIGNAAAAGPPAGPFALAPALALQGALDYTKKADAAIFQAATKPLTSSFDLQNPNVNILIEALRAKTSTFGWEDIVVVDVAGTHINILDGYGRISHDEAIAWVTTYINGQGRAAQNDYQLYACLIGSMSPDTLNSMTNEKSKYQVAGKLQKAPIQISP